LALGGEVELARGIALPAMSTASAPDDILATHEQARGNSRPPLLVLEPLRDFLDANDLGAGRILATPIGEGHSNVTYLIDAGLSKASEAHLDASEPRKLLDESIRLRATDYAAALAKARECLASLQLILKAIEPQPGPPSWPFRRSPGSP